MHKEFLRHPKSQSDGAVLFVHGFLGSPNQFCEFVDLVPDNFAVHNLLLDGHGGTVTDFSHSSMNKWKAQVDKAANDLISRYKKIVIMAHSMGTFFAMDAAIKYSDAVRGIFLLATPLKISVRKSAITNTFKSIFAQFDEADEVGIAYKKANSVILDKRLWLYLGWIPRYIELFKECAAARQKIKNVNSRCIIYQSEKDELVTPHAMSHIPQKQNITVNTLKNSQHFIYDKTDFDSLKTEFSKLLAEM